MLYYHFMYSIASCNKWINFVSQAWEKKNTNRFCSKNCIILIFIPEKIGDKKVGMANYSRIYGQIRISPHIFPQKNNLEDISIRVHN